MSELLSVGLDVGTTTTQMIVSKLAVENKASSFAVPEMQIVDRQVIYTSPVEFTPLMGENLVDGEGVREFVVRQYQQAGITPEMVDTGAVIITGETSRKENARAVLESLSGFAGDFVVATAGPSLESILAAKGAGADRLSAHKGKTVLHIDIGGGTSNLALLKEGKIVATGCMNVGGRLIKQKNGKITYVSPVLEGLTDLRPGDYPAPAQIEGIARILVTALEMAAGMRPVTELLEKLWTEECGAVWEVPKEACLISFSGGVADCIQQNLRPGIYGDMGVELGEAIGKSLLCKGEYALGQQTIRATVIGAGCHSAQLSGSTVFYQNVELPMKNLPVICVTEEEQSAEDFSQRIRSKLQNTDSHKVALALPGFVGSYEKLTGLAQQLLEALEDRPLIICLEADMAKALGQKLCLLLPKNTPCLCIDRVKMQPESYLDIGAPVGPALPVVVKTLVLSS